MSAAADADRIVQKLKVEALAGELTGATLTALGDWIDRVGRLSKIVINARINERQVQLQEAQASIVIQAFKAALATVPDLLPAERDQVVRAFLVGIGRARAERPGLEVVRGEVE